VDQTDPLAIYPPNIFWLFQPGVRSTTTTQTLGFILKPASIHSLANVYRKTSHIWPGSRGRITIDYTWRIKNRSLWVHLHAQIKYNIQAGYITSVMVKQTQLELYPLELPCRLTRNIYPCRIVLESMFHRDWRYAHRQSVFLLEQVI
jgi:hypothetical protein